MARDVYVDESKRRDYLMVAAAIAPSDLSRIRATLRGYLMPGQRRLHMKDENDSRKRAIAGAIAASGVDVVIYNAGRDGSEQHRRAACLTALVQDIARRGDDMLVIEQDDTLIDFDRKRLYRGSSHAWLPRAAL